jgi:LysR family glycine cleavage system transcriptional activator
LGRRLADQDIFPVCSPSLAKQITCKEDLLKVPLIHVSGILEDWQTWFEAMGMQIGASTQGHLMMDYSGSLEMARQGLGVAMAQGILAQDLLDRGELVVPFDFRLAAKDSFYLIAPEKLNQTKNIIAFVDWIENQFGL